MVCLLAAFSYIPSFADAACGRARCTRGAPQLPACCHLGSAHTLPVWHARFQAPGLALTCHARELTAFPLHMAHCIFCYLLHLVPVLLFFGLDSGLNACSNTYAPRLSALPRARAHRLCCLVPHVSHAPHFPSLFFFALAYTPFTHGLVQFTLPSYRCSTSHAQLSRLLPVLPPTLPLTLFPAISAYALYNLS